MSPQLLFISFLWIAVSLASAATSTDILPFSSASSSTLSPIPATATTDSTYNQTVGASSSPQLRPLEERVCFAGIVCIHGKCAPPGPVICACDAGWSGPFCNTPLCLPPCGAHGTCQVEDHTAQPQCFCASGFTGDICETALPTTTDNTTIADVHTTTDISPPLPIQDPWEPHEDSGPLPPLLHRSCPQLPHFVCRYGNCSFNGVEAKCDCLPGFDATFCDKPCTLDCGEKGQCKLKNGIGPDKLCVCTDHKYAGANCTLTPVVVGGASDKLPPGVIASLCLAAGLLLILLVTAVVVWTLWRKRNITIMKMVYWFKDFEEDDDREWDAFVSYASAELDNQFVLGTLVPMLEGRMNFDLCLHQRDFLAGQYISQNISEAVQRSRRTLMVLSPSFIRSDWCRFEFQMALQEMVKERHRILPVLLDDISSLKDDMDSTLKKLLETVTWIKYPGPDASEKELDQFWKRISLSMPKKRDRSTPQPQNNHDKDQTASQHTSSKATVVTKPSTTTGVAELQEPQTVKGDSNDICKAVSEKDVILVPDFYKGTLKTDLKKGNSYDFNLAYVNFCSEY